MRSYRDYSQNTSNKGKRETEKPTKEEAASAEELTKRIAAAYNGKSNADMLRSILAEAERSKKAGTLSNEEIENFYKSFAPMLDGFQRKRLRAVVDRLKEI